MRRQNGLYRRNGGIFCFRYKDKDGAWREKSTGTSDRDDAKTFKEEWEDDNRKEELPTHKADWTVEKACTLFVDTHKLGSARAKSNERSLLRPLVRMLGSKKLKHLTFDDLKAYRTQRGEVEGKSNRTINLELRILVRVLKEEGLWKGKLKANYKALPENDGDVPQALTTEQLAHLQETASANDRWLVAYLATVLAANSGMRAGEIRKTTLGVVDLDKGQIAIRRRATKTNKGARMVELNDQALAAVRILYKRALTHGASDPDHFLLPADLSKHVSEKDPLRGRSGFDVTCHQQSWRTAWKNLRAPRG